MLISGKKSDMCPLCGATDGLTDSYTVRDVWSRHHDVMFCSDCGLYFMPRPPSEAEMAVYYDKQYHRLGKAMAALKMVFRNARCESQHAYIERLAPTPPASILEVGAADGMLLSKFRRTGAALLGLDYNHTMAEIARARYGVNVVDRDIFSVAETYDLIVMSHTLEHFPDIVAVMTKLKATLAPGGLLFVEVPQSPTTTDSTRSEIDDYLQTTHTYNFTSRSLARLLVKFGLEPLDVSRHFYRGGVSLPRDARRSFGHALLSGGGLSVANCGRVAGFVMRSVMDPAGSFERVPDGAEWMGQGECIRALARKKAGE